MDSKGDILERFAELLRSEQLCYDDLDKVDILEINTSDSGEIEFGFEVFDNDALLRSVIIAPEYRGKGNGSTLLDMAVQVAKESGIQNLFLLTTTASGFFEKFGFSKIERDSVPEGIAKTGEFVTFCPDSAICMKYEI